MMTTTTMIHKCIASLKKAGPRVQPNFNDNKRNFKVKHRMQMMQEPNTPSLIFFLSSYYCSFLLLLCLHPFITASFPSFTLSVFVKLRSVGLPCRSGAERPVNSGLPNKNSPQHLLKSRL